MQGKLAIRGGPRTVPEGAATRWPIIAKEDKQAVMDVLDRGILSGVDGPEATGLEKDFADFLGADHAIATGSGTSALHCAVFGAGVGPGDEVITSAFSFSASFHAILMQNAIPVFVDIDPQTYNIDVDQIEAKITDRTKAILPVHIHGLPAEMDVIMNLAEKHNLGIIEDACQAHGAEYKGRKVGTLGKAGAFSLNTTKNLPGGEGGIMVTADDELLERARQLRIFGEKIPEKEEKIRSYAVYGVGYQYRTQELPAAFARSQLKRLAAVNRNAQRNCTYFSTQLAEIPGIMPPHVPPDRTSIFHKYRIRFQPDVLQLKMPAVEFRGRLLDALQAEGVSVAIWHIDTLPAYPIFRQKEGWGRGCPWGCPHYGREISYRRDDYPETIRLLEESIIIGDEAFPLFIQSRELIEYYAAAIGKVLSNLNEILE